MFGKRLIITANKKRGFEEKGVIGITFITLFENYSVPEGPQRAIALNKRQQGKRRLGG